MAVVCGKSKNDYISLMVAVHEKFLICHDLIEVTSRHKFYRHLDSGQRSHVGSFDLKLNLADINLIAKQQFSTRRGLSFELVTLLIRSTQDVFNLLFNLIPTLSHTNEDYEKYL